MNSLEMRHIALHRLPAWASAVDRETIRPDSKCELREDKTHPQPPRTTGVVAGASSRFQPGPRLDSH